MNAPDILGVVGADGRLLCACGCRAAITDRSPSAYFASEMCSARWHGHSITAPMPAQDAARINTAIQAAAPRRVAREPDADPIDLRAAPAAAWLDSVDPRFVAGALLHRIGEHLHIEIPAQCWPVRYTRQCGNCSLVAPPKTIARTERIDRTVPNADLIQACPACYHPHPGAYLTFVAFVHPAGDIRMEMTDGRARVASEIAAAEGALHGDLTAVHETVLRADLMWRRLERLLVGFAEIWMAGPPASASRPEQAEPYTFDVSPPRRTTYRPPWLGRA